MHTFRFAACVVAGAWLFACSEKAGVPPEGVDPNGEIPASELAAVEAAPAGKLPEEVPAPKTLEYRGPTAKDAPVSAYTFTKYERGMPLYIAAVDTNVRKAPSADAEVVRKLPLGMRVIVGAPSSEAVRVGGRVDRWYEVYVLETGAPEPSAPEGHVFGGALTPFSGSVDLDGDTDVEDWAAVFTKKGSLAVRVSERSGPADKRATATALSLTQKDKAKLGGTARVRAEGLAGESAASNDENHAGIVLAETCIEGACRLAAVGYDETPGGKGKLSTITRRTVPKDESLDVRYHGGHFWIGDVRHTYWLDRQRYRAEGQRKAQGAEWKKAVCPGCEGRKVSVLVGEPPASVLEVEPTEEQMGPDEEEYSISCKTFAHIAEGPRAGKKVIGCANAIGGKDGPTEWRPLLFVLDGERWIEVDTSFSSGDWREPSRALLRAQKAIKLSKDGGMTFTGIPTGKHEVIYEDERGRVAFVGWYRRGLEITPETTAVAFHHVELGPVYVARPSGKTARYFQPETGKGPEGGAFFVPSVYGGVAVYQWQPAVSLADGDVSWRDEALAAETSGATYQPHFRMTCGAPELVNVVVDDVPRDQLVQIGTAKDIPLYGLPAEHPYHERFFREEVRGPHGEKVERTPEETSAGTKEMLAKLPYFFVEDSFGRLVQMTRDGVDNPSLCEPVLYLYPPSPTPVRVEVGRVSITKSRPMADGNAWSYVAEPDGRVRVAEGRLPFLFWEGEGAAFPFPERGAVVARDDVGAYLRDALVRHGLAGREVTDFLDAWLPRMLRHEHVAIAFHERAFIDELSPLSITPAPDRVLRVLMDWRPAKAGETLPPAPLPSSPPARSGYVAVEWGGVMR